MDTKFWGPSGWKLLHILTFTYEPTMKKPMGELLDTLPYVLPCKFCRASLTDYYEADRPDLDDLPHWLYRIHNQVNKKLRGQGQAIPLNPTFRDVETYYKSILPNGHLPADCNLFPGWDFLFSIAYNHPLSVKGSPMPNAPPPTGLSDAELNRWNLLPPQRRYTYWRRFWSALVKVLPDVWRKAWLKAAEPATLTGRRFTVAWLWRVRCKFSEGADPYKVVCERLASYESGCSKSTRARTCRRSSTRKR
jgi:hypothetical protein